MNRATAEQCRAIRRLCWGRRMDPHERVSILESLPNMAYREAVATIHVLRQLPSQDKS